MKLRKVGNSLGATFSREALSQAGFTVGQELEVIAKHGEIKIRPASASTFLVGFTADEVKALAAREWNSKPGESALSKVREIIADE